MASSTTRPGATAPALSATRRDRQGRERRPGRLAGSLGAVPRRGRLCLARRPARRRGGREPGGLRLRHPRPDHLGQGPPGPRPRPLPLAARALLVRGRRAPATGRGTASRPRSGRSPAATRTPRPCTARRSRSSACAGRSRTTRRPGQAVYEPFSGSGTTIIAAEMSGPGLPRGRALAGLRRCRGPALAGLHRPAGRAGERWPSLPRDRGGAAGSRGLRMRGRKPIPTDLHKLRGTLNRPATARAGPASRRRWAPCSRSRPAG